MNKRQSPVPEGHATIAQRFNVGLISNERSSPEGTAETAREPSAVPSGLTTGYLVLPNVETLGYCRASLRDEEQILVALDLSTPAPEDGRTPLIRYTIGTIFRLTDRLSFFFTMALAALLFAGCEKSVPTSSDAS